MAEMYIFCFPIFPPNMSGIFVLLFLQSSYSRLWASKWVGNGDGQEKLQLLRMPSKKSIPLLHIILQLQEITNRLGNLAERPFKKLKNAREIIVLYIDKNYSIQ